jgi:hypothetical protein
MRHVSTHRSDLALGALAALAALLLLAVAYAAAWPLAVDVGGRDARFALGFNEPEFAGSRSFRWTDGDSIVALPRPPANAPALLALDLQNGRPADQPAAQLAIAADGRELLRLTIPPGDPRTFQMLVPPTDRADWALRIHLASDSILLAHDPRPLGVVLNRATLTPMRALPLPGTFLLLLAAALGGCAYGALRLAGLHRSAAFAGATIAAALVALGVAAIPNDVLPFVQRLAAIPALACLGLGLGRALVPLDEQGRVAGAHLPILMALAWWMLPLFQVVMRSDDAPGVGLATETLWVGAGLLAGLAGIGVWYAVRGRSTNEPRVWLANRALVIFAVAAAVHFGYNLWFAYQRQAPDFWILFRGAREWVRGGSLYDLQAVMTNHFGHVFKVPPFYGMLFVPFVFEDGLTILLFHRITNTILIGATALVWLRMWDIRPFSLAAASLPLLLNFRPLADTLAYGQIDLMLLFLLTLALWALRSGRDAAAGALVALGTLFKIYPVVLLAFFVAKRRWGALWGFAAAMAVCNGLALAVMGWEMHRVYLFEVVPNIGGTTSWVENQTISGFLARLTDSPREADIFANPIIRLVGTGISGLVALAGCLLALRPSETRSTTFALQYGVFLLLMVLTVPAAWMHYQTLLFVTFGALLLHERGRWVALPRAALLAIAFGLIAYGNQWSFYDGTIMGALTIAGVSYKFYGMLLLAGLLAATIAARWQPAPLPRPAPAMKRA